MPLPYGKTTWCRRASAIGSVPTYLASSVASYRMPSSTTSYRGSWNGLTVISIAIGQGEILATPLQIANLGATIANRGHFITPHIVKEIEDNELDSIYRNPRYPTIDREYYEWW